MNEKKILLINGSPRKKGTSNSILLTLQQLAKEKGMEARIVHAIEYYDGKADIAALRSAIQKSDILCLSAPLYFDALPCPAIWLLEQMQENCADALRGKAFFALSQGGFPDAALHEPPLEQCRIFAMQTGMVWRGGMAHGGGAIIDGKPLNELGKKGVKLTDALGMALDAALSGGQIPEEAKKRFSNKMPGFVFPLLCMLLNSMAKKTAKKEGSDYLCRPYLEKE